LQLLHVMDLRCKVFRGAEAGELEASINRFLSEELADEGEAQLEEITQSEGAGGVTVTIWYSLVDTEALVDEYEGEHPSGEMA
jgi:hypothetical protein